MVEKTAKKTTRAKKTTAPKKATTKAATTKATAPKTVATKATSAALSIPVFSLAGQETGTVNLPEELFKVEASPRLVAQYVRVYLANQRQGTHSTKHRSEVKGSTKKIYRQKGTGNARHGSAKAPLFVGGGVESGPKPVDHSLKMNKKQKRKALLAVLSSKVKANAVAALGSDVIGMKPQTKTFVGMLKSMGAENKKVMVVVSKPQEGMKLSMRNLKKVEMVSTSGLNAYNVLHHDRVLFSEDALTQLSTLYLEK